nr:hypothetical protein [Crenothrix polyspora]
MASGILTGLQFWASLEGKRESGQVQLEVKRNSARKDLDPTVLNATQSGATINTDEWGGLTIILQKQIAYM